MRVWAVDVGVMVVALGSVGARLIAWAGPDTVVTPPSAIVRIATGPAGSVELSGPWGTRRYRAGEPIALSVQGGAPLEVGALAAGRIELAARRIHVRGALQASGGVSLRADDLIEVEAPGSVDAPEVRVAARVFSNVGRVTADGARGGRIEIRADDVLNQGLLSVRGRAGDGGRVDIVCGRSFLESARGSIDASGAGRGGAIRVAGARGSHLFTSGRETTRGAVGGRIALVADDVKLVVAALDASGVAGGGAVDVGDRRAGTREVLVGPGTRLQADGEAEGSGGRVVLASLERTRFGGRASARGGARAGNGGLVDISSVGGVLWQGELDTGAPAGTAGRVVVDPKNMTISETSGGLLRYELVDPAPDPSANFGAQTTVLPSGNVLVNGVVAGGGAMHLFSGKDGALIATLFAISGGADGVKILGNGNYVVIAPRWTNGAATEAGAITWGNGQTGVAGAISSSNSLVGTSAYDHVGGDQFSLLTGVSVLSNGNYVVSSVNWDNGATADAGAATWCSGATGCVGVVSPSNSLVGSTAGDRVGSVAALTSGNYVATAPTWDNGGASDVGAVTWCSGATGCVGVVSASNSLIGATAGDNVGHTVVALANGNYAVESDVWDNGGIQAAGAVTWCNGATGRVGVVSSANSLVGSAANDAVGSDGIVPLPNGSFVIRSPDWQAGGKPVGAVTWVNGATGAVGPLSASNSLVGVTTDDHTNAQITILANGNYVVWSPRWTNPSNPPFGTYAGAVTWCSGTTGRVGVVSASNSLVGTVQDDIGVTGVPAVTALSNGNYVVVSPWWDASSASKDAGAVTWGDGATGTAGVISAQNSLVGSRTNDRVGGYGVTALTNGNYVVSTYSWSNGGAANAGAVTWGNGATGTVGTVSASNSLVGSTAGDQIGYPGVIALSNGNYVVASRYWDNGTATDVGAATWGNGSAGVAGPVSASNSLVGSASGDGWNSATVGGIQVTALSDGNYIVINPAWDNGAVADAGAATWGNGAIGTVGVVSAGNSIIGSTANDRVGSCSGRVPAPLPGGAFLICSQLWDNGALVDAGAVTAFAGGGPVAGVVSAANSVIGARAMGGARTPVAGPLPGTFLATFFGQVYIGAYNLDGVKPEYDWLAGNSFAIRPALVASTLSRGLPVTLEASNDITVASAVNAGAQSVKGGSLTLAAGRSIYVAANLATGGGDLTLIANDLLANGVVDAQRDDGPGSIRWTAGAALDAGSGTVQVLVRNGAGKTHAASGPLELGDVTAGKVVGRAEGNALALTGTVTATGPGDAIVLSSDTVFDAPAAAATALSTPTGRFLIYAPGPGMAMTGSIPLSFEEFEKPYPAAPDAAHAGSGILFAAARPQPDTNPTVTIDQGATQVDPTSASAIVFDVVFDRAVSGFDAADVDLALSTAAGPLTATVDGGPSRFTATVTGMSGAGQVIARVPGGACTGAAGGLPSLASTSIDNMVSWTPPVVEPSDGGTGTDGGSGSDAGTGTDAGTTVGDAARADGHAPDAATGSAGSGCSCAVGATPGGSAAAVVLVFALAARRRRTSKPPARRS